MGTPVEKQNLSLPFFVLSMLIAAATVWAFYDELVTRRPWKQYQERIFGFEQEKAKLDLAYYERAGQMDSEAAANVQAALRLAQSGTTAIAQYWLTSFDGSVDRCQSCHASIERCGFTRPQEVLEAIARSPESEAQALATYCVTPETLAAYREVEQALCTATWASEGAGCVPQSERQRVADLVRDHCGPSHPAMALLTEPSRSACLDEDSWRKAAGYLEDPLHRSGSWSVCELGLSPEGDSCLEGAKRDQLFAWLARRCEPNARIMQARTSPKVCATKEDSAKFSALNPVLYELPLFAQTHPQKEALLGSVHPPERFGCTSCHQGQGAQTKGVAGRPFAHGHDDPYWEEPLLDLVRYRKFRPKRFGPPAPGEEVPGEWVDRQQSLVQSSCARCHEQAVSLAFAETYTKGRNLAFELGCQGCHPIGALASRRKPAPSLSWLKQKSSPEFLVRWLSHPADFRPGTRMPNFWPEAIDGSGALREGSAEAKQRALEVEQLAAFLWKSAKDEELPLPPIQGDATRGERLAHQLGCRACHNFVPQKSLCTPAQLLEGKSKAAAGSTPECESPRSFGPNLSNVGLKASERWLFAWLKDPSKLWRDVRMPSLRLSDPEAADLAAYLSTLRDGPALGAAPAIFSDTGSKEFSQAVEEGSKLVRHYGCAGCHEIEGHLEDVKVGAELDDFGRKPLELFDFGKAVPDLGHRSWYAFVDLKLRAPHAFRYERVDTRMPQYELSDDEVEALIVFLKSRRLERPPEEYRVASYERPSAIAQGQRVQEEFNCKGCHVIDGLGGDLRDTFIDDELWMAPPLLQQEGFRVQPEWLFGYLKEPIQSLRPWLKVRMPTFPLDDREATALVKGFAASSKASYPYLSLEAQRPEGARLKETEALVAELRCYSCHTLGKAADQDMASLAPDLSLGKRRLRPDWVRKWIEDPQSLQEGTRMPAYFTKDDLDTPLYPSTFGGSQRAQMDALRDYFMSLPDSPKR